MSNDKKISEIPVTETPEWLAEQVVTFNNDGDVVLSWARGARVATIRREMIGAPSATGAHGVTTLRAWLVEQIKGAYKAGVEAGREEGQKYIAQTLGLPQDGGASEIRERIVEHVKDILNDRDRQREEDRKAGYSEAVRNLEAYIQRRRERKNAAVHAAEVARNALVEAEKDVLRMTAEVAGLVVAVDVLDPVEIPF